MREVIFGSLVVIGYALVAVHWVVWLRVWIPARRATPSGQSVRLPAHVPEGLPLDRAFRPWLAAVLLFVVTIAFEGDLGMQGFGDWVGSLFVFFWMALGFGAAHAWLEPRLPAWSRWAVVAVMALAGFVAGGLPDFLVAVA